MQNDVVGKQEEEDRLSNRLAWVTGLRLGFLSLLLASTAFFYLRGALSQYPQSQAIVLGSIGAAFALAAIYATLLRRKKHLHQLAVAQIVLDQMTWTAIVYVSGGATSGATSFYGLTCLVGAILIGLRGAAIAAIAGVGAFTALCAGFAFHTIVPPADQRAGLYIVEWDAIIYPLAVNALGIVVVALLAGYLADRLRRTGGALQEANARAASAERLAMLGRIAAGLAHEIRNPLGSISGSIELLREAPGLGEEDRRLCEIIQREAGRLNHLVSDMMDLSRPRKPEPEPVDVASLARDVVELASRSERSAGDVAVEYDGPSHSVWAMCDGAQMRQVLWNLVRNGVQASGAGTTVTVRVRETPPTKNTSARGRAAAGEPARANESARGRAAAGEPARANESARVLMSVSDQGPGIEPEARDKIFDAFFTTRSHGAGMGLAVVRRIIDDHAPFGVTIQVRSSEKSAPNQQSGQVGATFEVGLARTPSPGTRQVQGASEATPSSPPASHDHVSDLVDTSSANLRSRPLKNT